MFEWTLDGEVQRWKARSRFENSFAVCLEAKPFNLGVLLIPECVARVPVSLSGCGGKAVFAERCVYVCNRPQPFAWGPYGRAYIGTFGAFHRRVASFRVAGVALRDIPTCFKTCQKSFCVAGATLLQHFQKMCCIFRDRGSTLDTSDLILRGRHSTLDVSCCVVFANLIVSAARSGDKVQIPWQAWHFVTCDENRRKPRTKRRFCGSYQNS